MDVNSFNGWIVCVNGQYLVAVAYEDTRMCRWSSSPFDALLFDDVNDAVRIANPSGGYVRRFNPVTGRIGG